MPGSSSSLAVCLGMSAIGTPTRRDNLTFGPVWRPMLHLLSAGDQRPLKTGAATVIGRLTGSIPADLVLSMLVRAPRRAGRHASFHETGGAVYRLTHCEQAARPTMSSLESASS